MDLGSAGIIVNQDLGQWSARGSFGQLARPKVGRPVVANVMHSPHGTTAVTLRQGRGGWPAGPFGSLGIDASTFYLRGGRHDILEAD